MANTANGYQDVVTNLLFRGFQGYFRGFQSVVAQMYPNFSLFKESKAFTNESLKGRLATIAQAKTNIEATLAQVEELRRQTEQHQVELGLALDQIKEIQKRKPDLTVETAGIEKVAMTDTDSFRASLGVPSVLDIWRERALGFGSGFVGCILVYIILKFLQAIF